MNIQEVLKRHQEHLMGLPGVTGVGIGEREGQPALLVLLNRPASEVRDKIPRSLDGFPVALEDVGDLNAL